MKRRSVVTIVLAIVLSALIVGNALAAGSWYSYNLTVPRMGGGVSTNNQTKQSQTDTATICMQSVGGGYTMNARIQTLANRDTSTAVRLGSLQRGNLTYTSPVQGASYHAVFWSDLTTFVNVQIIGNWSPDNPGACGF